EGFEMRFTQFQGGDTVNKVPDHAYVQFFLTSHQFEDFKRFFRETTKSEGKEKNFRVEYGGIVDSGVKFLPDPLYSCLIDIVEYINALSQDLANKKDESYDPAFSTVNFGKLKQRLGGIDLNFDLRLLPEISPKDVEAQIKTRVQEMTSKYPNLNVNVVLERMNPGLNMQQNDEWVGICRDAMGLVGIPAHFSKKATSTEASQYFSAGYPAVVFGAGRSQGNSHSPNEHNLMDQMEKSIAFYEEVIKRVCL
ncbi:M20/M25/M40 family metallo-hydrolase, partial [bacterium]|nr:M20/M25/M40 family metallo-hydrolase [bacterium]